jgi:hypothetical protein
MHDWHSVYTTNDGHSGFGGVTVEQDLASALRAARTLRDLGENIDCIKRGRDVVANRDQVAAMLLSRRCGLLL